MNSTSEVVNHLYSLTLKLTPTELETLRLKLEVESQVSVYLNFLRPDETALLVHQYSLHMGRVVFKNNDNSFKLINTYWMWDGTTQYVLSCTNNDIPDYVAVMPIGTHSDLVRKLRRFNSDFEKYLDKDPSLPLSILLHDYKVETVQALLADLDWALDNLSSETGLTPQWAWDCLKYYLPKMRELAQMGLPINP